MFWIQMMLASTLYCCNFIINCLNIWKNILMMHSEHLNSLHYFLNLFYLNEGFKWKKILLLIPWLVCCNEWMETPLGRQDQEGMWGVGVVNVRKQLGMDDGPHESLWVRIVGDWYGQHYGTRLLQTASSGRSRWGLLQVIWKSCVFSGPAHHRWLQSSW